MAMAVDFNMERDEASLTGDEDEIAGTQNALSYDFGTVLGSNEQERDSWREIQRLLADHKAFKYASARGDDDGKEISSVLSWFQQERTDLYHETITKCLSNIDDEELVNIRWRIERAYSVGKLIAYLQRTQLDEERSEAHTFHARVHKLQKSISYILEELDRLRVWSLVTEITASLCSIYAYFPRWPGIVEALLNPDISAHLRKRLRHSSVFSALHEMISHGSIDEPLSLGDLFRVDDNGFFGLQRLPVYVRASEKLCRVYCCIVLYVALEITLLIFDNGYDLSELEAGVMDSFLSITDKLAEQQFRVVFNLWILEICKDHSDAILNSHDWQRKAVQNLAGTDIANVFSVEASSLDTFFVLKLLLRSELTLLSDEYMSRLLHSVKPESESEVEILLQHALSRFQRGCKAKDLADCTKHWNSLLRALRKLPQEYHYRIFPTVFETIWQEFLQNKPFLSAVFLRTPFTLDESDLVVDFLRNKYEISTNAKEEQSIAADILTALYVLKNRVLDAVNIHQRDAEAWKKEQFQKMGTVEVPIRLRMREQLISAQKNNCIPPGLTLNVQSHKQGLKLLSNQLLYKPTEERWRAVESSDKFMHSGTTEVSKRPKERLFESRYPEQSGAPMATEAVPRTIAVPPSTNTSVGAASHSTSSFFNSTGVDHAVTGNSSSPPPVSKSTDLGRFNGRTNTPVYTTIYPKREKKRRAFLTSNVSAFRTHAFVDKQSSISGSRLESNFNQLDAMESTGKETQNRSADNQLKTAARDASASGKDACEAEEDFYGSGRRAIRASSVEKESRGEEKASSNYKSLRIALSRSKQRTNR